LFVAGCGRGFFDPDLSGECDASSTTAGPAPTFVQANYATSGSTQDVGTAAGFPLPQAAGNTIVAVVMWDSTSSNLMSVSDDVGNAYQTAIGPTRSPGYWSQVVYVAPNIAAAGAGVNVVHAAFTTGSFVRIAVAEYAAVDNAQPLDGTSAMVGDSTVNVTAGSITTTHVSDRLVGATSSRISVDGNYPNFMLRESAVEFVIQDLQADTPRAYAPAAQASGNSGDWVAQLIALRRLGY